MFIPIKVLDENGEYFYEQINPFHITRISIHNPKNIDEGSNITLRTGEIFYSPEPIDLIDKRLNEIIEKFTATMLIQIINEYATTQNVKPKKPTTRQTRKKTTK